MRLATRLLCCLLPAQLPSRRTCRVAHDARAACPASCGQAGGLRRMRRRAGSSQSSLAYEAGWLLACWPAAVEAVEAVGVDVFRHA